MAPQNIKIIYFNARGRAELARLVLVAAGQKYEDVRLAGEQWQAEKPNTPFGSLPVLEIDGKRFAQSVAIATYLAKEFGFYGQSNLQALEIDQIVHLVQDYIAQLVKVYFEKDEAKKAELAKNLQEVETPKYFGHFEKLLKKNGNGHFVGDKLSLADLVVFDVVFNVRRRNPDVLGNFPLLKQFVSKIESIEKIKEHIAKRPETEN